MYVSYCAYHYGSLYYGTSCIILAISYESVESIKVVEVRIKIILRLPM